METFKEWAICLVVAGFAGTLVSLLSPSGTMEKTLRAVIGIFLVSSVVSPLARLAKEEKLIPAFVSETVTESADGELFSQMLEAYENTVRAVALETAKEHGIKSLGVDTDMYIDENDCIIIRKICINIPKENIGNSQLFSAELEEKLGVSVTVSSE